MFIFKFKSFFLPGESNWVHSPLVYIHIELNKGFKKQITGLVQWLEK